MTYVGIDGTDYASSTAAPTEVGKYHASASFAATRTHGEQQHGRLRHHPGHGHDHGHRLQRRVDDGRRRGQQLGQERVRRPSPASP